MSKKKAATEELDDDIALEEDNGSGSSDNSEETLVDDDHEADTTATSPVEFATPRSVPRLTSPITERTRRLRRRRRIFEEEEEEPQMVNTPPPGPAAPAPAMDPQAAFTLIADRFAQIDADIRAIPRPPPAAPVAPAQRKIPTFEDASNPRKWLEWRRRFEAIARGALWDDEHKKREMFAAMVGPASAAIHDIPYENTPGYQRTFREIADLYEARFVNRAASNAARTDFNRAQQQPQETLLEWHGRLRDLFVRAYPNHPGVDQGELGTNLRERFAVGLESASIQEYVLDKDPATYADCLTDAETKSNTLVKMKDMSQVAAALHAIQQVKKPIPRDAGGACYYCYRDGHFKIECAVRKTDEQHGLYRTRIDSEIEHRNRPAGQANNQRNLGRKNPPYRGRVSMGGPTRTKNFPKGTGRVKRSVHSMEPAEEEVEDGGNSEEEEEESIEEEEEEGN